MSLQRLKVIRDRRLERKTLVVASRKEKVRLAEKEIDEAKKALNDFSIWRNAQEQHDFDALQSEVFSVKDLQKYTDTKENMKQDHINYQETIKETEANLEQAKKSHKEARLELELEAKKLEKVKEMMKEELVILKMDELRQEEMANEEIYSIKR